MFYTIKLCRGKASYEAIPKKDLKLNLIHAGAQLESADYTLLTHTPVLLIAQKSKKITIYPSGKLKIEDASEEEADKLAKEIYEALGFA